LRYTEKPAGDRLAVAIEGAAHASTRLFVFKPAANGVEQRVVPLDPAGRATAEFDATTVTDAMQPLAFGSAAPPSTAAFMARNGTTSGKWRGTYGSRAAWLAGQPLAAQHGYVLNLRHGITYVWGKDDQTPRVLELPPGATGSKLAACWTAGEEFDLRLKCPKDAASYTLTVYLVDYDNIRYAARAMELSIRTHDGTVLNTQHATKAQTNTGIYLTWTVSGPVTIHARKTDGCNAAVSGVFVDAVPTPKKETER